MLNMGQSQAWGTVQDAHEARKGERCIGVLCQNEAAKVIKGNPVECVN